MHEQAIDAVFRGGELRVVVIVGVDGDAIDKGRETRGSFLGCSDDGGFTFANAETFDVALGDGAAFRAGARQCQSQTIEDRFLAQVDYFLGKALVFRIKDKLGNVFRQAGSLGEITSGSAAGATRGIFNHR
jgi:hypothetical protein